MTHREDFKKVAEEICEWYFPKPVPAQYLCDRITAALESAYQRGIEANKEACRCEEIGGLCWQCCELNLQVSNKKVVIYRKEAMAARKMRDAMIKLCQTFTAQNTLALADTESAYDLARAETDKLLKEGE